MEIKDTNGDHINIVTNVGRNLLYLEGGYACHHLFKEKELFDVLGNFLGYEMGIDISEVVSEENNEYSINNQIKLSYNCKKFLDFSEKESKIRLPMASISKYSANKLFKWLAERNGVEICE